MITYVYHMVGKLFEDTWLTSLVDFCEIASRHVLAKAKMIGFVGVRRNSIGQIAKAVTVAQLPEQMSCISTSEDTLDTISSISIWNGENGFDCTVVSSILFILIWVQISDKSLKETNKNNKNLVFTYHL